MADAIRLYLLGEFRLERAGEPLRLPTTKSKALLAYLALYPHKHPREKLAALFWGDSSDAAARKSLRVAFQHLYQALGKDAFLGDYEGVELVPTSHLWVDALALTASAAGLWQNGEAETIPALQSAVDSCGGELLEGFYDDWVVAAREQFRGQYLALALRLVEQYRVVSEYGFAAQTARKILVTDPAHEKPINI